MKKYLIYTAAIVLSFTGLMAASPANATILSEYYPPEVWGQSGPDWVTYPLTCSQADAVEFSIRAGDRSSVSVPPEEDKDEIYYMIGGIQDLADAGDYDIFNGVDFDFTLTHDSASGDFTWSFDGGPSTTWHSGRPGEAVQNFFLVAFSKSNKTWTTTVNNLVLNGQPISDTLFSADGDKPSMRIFGEPFSDFTLQGTGNFAWTGEPAPQGSQAELRVSVVFADDDIDGDGFGNACDNCPNISSTDLSDTDNDGVGNICDVCPGDPTNDEDNDGICGQSDNCPTVSNADQADCNGNGIGDVCDTVNPGALEICDNIDNNCNGSIDEGLTQPTSCGVGECGSTGIETCTAGVWGGDTCTPGTPSAEICDNLDNNCDGSIDEDLTQATSCGVGECGSTGIETCTAGTWGGDTCTPGTPTAEICGDGLDQDCDGGDLSCLDVDNDGDGQTENEGDCDDADPANFTGNAEICDGADNDCDTVADNGLTFTTYYEDSDSDLYGNAAVSQSTCDGAPSGYVTDNTDNCPVVSNADQADCDGDGIGDVCDPDSPCSTDTDLDGVMDSVDNCIDDPNTDQADCDGDGIGDVCDPDSPCSTDTDLDGVMDSVDNCVFDPNTDQADCDGDGIGDVCDPDSPCSTDTDLDGVMDSVDNCVFDANPSQADCDGDGIGDVCDPDSPCSTDTDLDGVPDSVDNCIDDPNTDQADADTDGIGDVCDDDIDGDTVLNVNDNCPTASNISQADCNGDGIGDACDAVNPGAVEICDTIDNNCDGNVDEGVLITFYLDIDGDTYGCPFSPIEEACVASPGYVDDITDCNENEFTANITGTEVCDDLIDNNCDGVVDEGCSWTPVQLVEDTVISLYGYIQGAYDGIIPNGDGNLNLQAETFSESVFMTLPDVGVVTLTGGFDADFNPLTGERSTIFACCGPALTVGGGTTVIAEHIILK